MTPSVTPPELCKPGLFGRCDGQYGAVLRAFSAATAVSERQRLAQLIVDDAGAVIPCVVHVTGDFDCRVCRELVALRQYSAALLLRSDVVEEAGTA